MAEIVVPTGPMFGERFRVGGSALDTGEGASADARFARTRVEKFETRRMKIMKHNASEPLEKFWARFDCTHLFLARDVITLLHLSGYVTSRVSILHLNTDPGLVL